SWGRSSGGGGRDGCGRTSATSRPATTPSRLSTRPSGSAGRRSSAFVGEDSERAAGSALLVDQRQSRGEAWPARPRRHRRSQAQCRKTARRREGPLVGSTLVGTARPAFPEQLVEIKVVAKI